MCSLIDILQWKKNQRDSDDFWHSKLTLKLKIWYFLTAPHYSNFQNMVISFEYSWFLAKNLSNFVSLPWKLHDWYCHTADCTAWNYLRKYNCSLIIMPYESSKIIKIAVYKNSYVSRVTRIMPAIWRIYYESCSWWTETV